MYRLFDVVPVPGLLVECETKDSLTNMIGRCRMPVIMGDGSRENKKMIRRLEL
jgi:hypothetical protein